MYQLTLALFIAFLFFSHPCRTETISSNSSTILADIYRPFLTNLPQSPARFNPFLGGQSFDVCCQLVVNESLVIDNDTLRIRPGQTFYRGDMATLERFPSFPCFAKFNGTMAGPPEDFWTPYSWCRRRCPGWAATKPEGFANWLKPLIAFILPSLIFCLSIPRRRRIEIPGSLFSGPGGVRGALLYAIKIPAAFVIVAVDVLVWLSVVFATSGPILVSAIYDALLDARILRFLQRHPGSNGTTIRSRAHLLLVVLLGNLDFEPAWHHSKLFVRELPQDDFLPPPSEPAAATGEASSTSPSPASLDAVVEAKGGLTTVSPITPMPLEVSRGGEFAPFQLQSVKSKLRAMLDSQPSFGTTVGAPVLFYLASFIWSVYEIESSYGT
ncbi:uncharacterized protein A1O5_00396 [Cladophialophora psammophila CBS 110553]|uniref:Uncharacterized protein n=1 Tax=Cladophialophora psammophila CBS 110553 TaxID=1182543 RepID=W9X6S1_9EURO|nr:uncharacterized protein A1O5_00396 [Cladophialophora psammophila CBS 110553]EXJ75888.1 hypothetical protein A1O5_00396 [Cladophialophora psammophila CBS 110553]